jgi:hypothetical protein
MATFNNKLHKWSKLHQFYVWSKLKDPFNEAKNKIDAIALYSCSNLQEYNKSYLAKHFFSLKK